MHVYVIERPDGLVKIGKSGNPTKRIHALENQGGFRSERAWISIPSDMAAVTEYRSHKALHHNRTVGEWFAVEFDHAVATVQSNGRLGSDEQITDDITNRINNRLAEIGLLPIELARRCGVTRASVSGWTTGKAKNIRPDHLVAIADAIGLEIRWLITGKGPRLSSEI
jgi:DNA-binding Xre family transcriptional regulator